MSDDAVRAAEDAFFGGLLAADQAALEAVLAPDFVLVDVMMGQVVPREALLGLVGSGELEFVKVERDPSEALLLRRRDAVVTVGRTRMTMRFQGAETTVRSRYTHVYVNDDGRWRLLSAQGTAITDPPGGVQPSPTGS